MPALGGAVITADALHLHAETLRQVVEDKGGHLLVGLKGNSGALLEEVAGAFAATNVEDIARDWSQGKSHGRLETRVAEIIAFETRTKYPHLGMAVRVTRTRETVRKGDVVGKSTEVSYYVATFPPDMFAPSVVQALVRGHWAIENRLHHVKDRSMMEDRYRARANVGSNVALVRSIVVMLKARHAQSDPLLDGRLRADSTLAVEMLFHVL